MTKQCNTCGKEKPLSDFKKEMLLKDGLKSDCADCKRKNQIKRRAAKKTELFSEYKEYIGFF